MLRSLSFPPLVLLLVVSSTLSQAWDNPYSPEIIQAFQAAAKENLIQAQGVATNTCIMSETEKCPLSAMPVNESTLVYPGNFLGVGETGCISGPDHPFAFQVIPRNLNNVHFYFQGGGACWDRASTWAHFCSQTASPINPSSGIFDPSNPQNPYADYTIVAVLYCSGDVHIGNVTQKWDTEPESGIPTVQRGYTNSISAATWAKNQGLGALDHLVVSGSSAGALGTQAAADFIPQFIEADQVTVIIDSYVGVFDCLGPLLERYGTCDVPLFADQPQYLLQKCRAKSLLITDWIPNELLDYPNYQWAFLQSKGDATQQTFYAAVAALCLDNPVTTPSDFYAWTNLLLEAYAPYPNFNVFFVDSTHHVYLTGNVVYTATTEGTNAKNGPKMIDFISSLESGKITSQCDGPPLDRTQFSGTDYCDSAYLPRP